VQRLFKFSGTLVNPHGFKSSGTISMHFGMYNDPYRGEPYWEEVQKVRPDAQGRYTVLLGETTPGGLPSDIFASQGRHWLGVQALGQPEQPRILLVELPSVWKPDPIASSGPIHRKTLLPTDPMERRLVLLLLTMFLAGTALGCAEVARWWKARTELYGEPPFTNLLSVVPGSARVRGAIQFLRFPISTRDRIAHSVESNEADQPQKVA
jgi:hypothetical protein